METAKEMGDKTMMVTCPNCGKRYDDEFRWTLCPHEFFAYSESIPVSVSTSDPNADVAKEQEKWMAQYRGVLWSMALVLFFGARDE
jgi:hypothetical protein